MRFRLNLTIANDDGAEIAHMQHHQHHVTPKQVAVEDSWVSAHVTIANDDGAEIAHLQITSHLSTKILELSIIFRL